MQHGCHQFALQYIVLHTANVQNVQNIQTRHLAKLRKADRALVINTLLVPFNDFIKFVMQR